MANTKVSALDEMTVPLGTDELLAIDDPGGTPASQRVSLSNLLLATSDIIPAARVYNSANISTPTATATTLTFDTERYDTDDIHDLVSNTGRLTCKTAGKYLIIGLVEYGPSTGVRIISIELNGGNYIARTTQEKDQNSRGPVVAIWDLAVNDYVTLVAVQSSGSAANVRYVADYSPEFMMTRIGD